MYPFYCTPKPGVPRSATHDSGMAGPTPTGWRAVSLALLLAPAAALLELKVWVAQWLPYAEQLDAANVSQYSDKWVHLGIFSLLSWIGAYAWRQPSMPRTRLLAGLLLMAVATECLQHWVPGRSASVADLLADLAGMALGALAAHALSRSPAYLHHGI